ncbi:glycosyltransferase family 2 protein [Marivita hallyeonensis]|uniref:Glycosyltransferase, GT2 family n=1 Tax=Marivita hallyeonensis TaxID=996342 RepID=A0A1M5UQ13_9RHOB|nr:glycosyltransferase family 2 protein [Marivita hallyeonensis]SHH65091.1 Glycosyltransferase, GT2 family [Marivita hallyeonensis]
MTEIVVVVLNYKTPDLAVQAAQSAARGMSGYSGAILLVDNDSPDNSFQRMQDAVLAADWPAHLNVQVLQSGHNGGFGAGNNFGIRAGLAICPQADYVYVLNPDACVDDTTISALVDYLEARPKVAFAGSWIYGDDGEDHCSAFRLPGLASEFESATRFGPVTRLLKSYVLPLHIPETSGPVGWVVGASFLARTSVLEEIGLFDETFFLYFEETDICLRAHRAGYEVHFVRESRTCHIGSVSTGLGTWERTPTYWFDSRWYYYSKNYGRSYAVAATVLSAIGTAFWRLRRRLEGKPNTDAHRHLRDMIAHAAKAVFRPTPKTAIRKMTALPKTALQPSLD